MGSPAAAPARRAGAQAGRNGGVGRQRGGAFIIPVGLAFQEAYRQRPGIKLQMGYDDYHPTLAGQYLASSVVYASLYERSPVGNPYDYFGALDKDTKAFVQKVADETVRKFYGR